MIEPPQDPAMIARGREGAHVQLVDHRLVPGAPAPVCIAPLVGRRIDQFACTMHVLGVETRSRVRHDQPFVDAVAIAAAGARGTGFQLEATVLERLHGELLSSASPSSSSTRRAAGAQSRKRALPSLRSSAPKGM